MDNVESNNAEDARDNTHERFRDKIIKLVESLHSSPRKDKFKKCNEQRSKALLIMNNLTEKLKQTDSKEVEVILLKVIFAGLKRVVEAHDEPLDVPEIEEP